MKYLGLWSPHILNVRSVSGLNISGLDYWRSKLGETVTLKSLVTIRMNEIFPCLAFYGQKNLTFLFRNRDKDIHKLCEGSGEEEIWTFF